MLVGELHRVVKILSKFSNQNSISEIFRSVELNKEGFRAASEFGNIEIWREMLEFDTPKLLNTVAFAGVISSLPGEGIIEFKPTTNQVGWVCGAAKGHWALVTTDKILPYIPTDTREFKWSPPKDFPLALDLAASACQAATVSVGLFGVIIEPLGNRLRMSSSNTISLATSQVDATGYPLTSSITIRPPVPAMLSTLLRLEPGCKVDISNDGIFLLSDMSVAHLPLSVKLDHDIGTVIGRFATESDVTQVDSKAIKQFLTRAKSLADKNMPPDVGFKITEGKIILEQRSIASSSEEYFIASGIASDKTFNSVSLPLNLMITSLEKIDTVVLDYLNQNILVLKGSTPEFKHIVGGKAKV